MHVSQEDRDEQEATRQSEYESVLRHLSIDAKMTALQMTEEAFRAGYNLGDRHGYDQAVRDCPDGW